jgi:hypothetical protein
MTYENLSLTRDALVLFALTWYDLLVSGGISTERLTKRWLLDVTSMDLSDLVDCLKGCDEFLLAREESCCSYDAFKQHLKADFPFVGKLISPLKEIVERWTKNQSILAFSQLHQAFAFLSHLSLKKLSDLKDDALRAYVDQNNALLLEKDVSLTLEERDIISTWFPRDCRYDLYRYWLPSHGPGAVANKHCKSKIDKYNDFGTDDLLKYIDNKLPKLALALPRPLAYGKKEFFRCSRLVLVPKSVSKLRTISAEPTTLQWYQQGFLKSLTRMINHHSYLRKRINLEDQSLNQHLADLGSWNGDYATIDLSNASDSVSMRHIRGWFFESGLREALVCSRSKMVEIAKGHVIESHKFAPMGSALCFPVECIVFCAIVEASIREDGGDVDSSIYRVYGDDIIVETQYAPTVIKRLQMNGFVVNKHKSFYHQRDSLNFRESCGGEYLDGEDVTPVRISRWFSGVHHLGKSASKILCLVDMCNTCFTKLPSVRRYLLGKLLTLPVNCRVPFGEDGEGNLFSTQPTNHQIPSRYHNDDLQTIEMWIGSSRVLTRRSKKVDEDIRYYEYRMTKDYQSGSYERAILTPEHRYLRFYRLQTTIYEEPVLISVTSPRGELWAGKLAPDHQRSWSPLEP